MSIAEKLQTIAENEQKVFNAGKVALLKDSQYMNTTVTGNPVRMNDVSPVEHQMGVVVSVPGATVQRYGKNILPINTVQFPTGDKVIWEGRISGSFVLSYKHNLTDTANPSATLFRWWYEDGTVGYGYSVASGTTAEKISGTITKIGVVSWCEAKGGSVYDIQLEYGTEPTGFEPGAAVQTVTAGADGTVNGVTSHYPTTTLVVDNGVAIDCSYLRDIDTYIERLMSELTDV